MKEEKEIFKPKLRITTLSENGNPLSDRLVDACTEMYAGPKVQHKGPIRIEVTLVNQQDISQFKEYLDKLSGNLPIKESAGRGRPSNTQAKELESPREDILADVEKMVNEGKSQQDIIKYLRDLGFVFILTEDFLYHFPEFKFDKKDVGEPTNNGQYLDSYSWMARCIKRAKDPKTDKFDPILSDIEVTYNGTPWTEGNEYEYNTTTGEFETKAGAITVPSATTTRDDTTGAVSITPGVSTITVTGTI